MRSLAYYSVFIGNNSNPTKMVPRLPSRQVHCHFFTNNEQLAVEASNSGWIINYIDLHPETEDECNIAAKDVKVSPYKYHELDNYDFTCFLDSKLNKPNHSKILHFIDTYIIAENHAIIMRKHGFVKPFVYAELDESMLQSRYMVVRDQMVAYIEMQKEIGLSTETSEHAACGFIIRDMKNPINREISLKWEEHIKLCGIQDQISFFFVKQLFPGALKLIEWDSPF